MEARYLTHYNGAGLTTRIVTLPFAQSSSVKERLAGSQSNKCNYFQLHSFMENAKRVLRDWGEKVVKIWTRIMKIDSSKDVWSKQTFTEISTSTSTSTILYIVRTKRQAFETQLKSWKHLENIRIHNSTVFRFDISTYLQAVIYSVLRFWAGKECAALSDGDDPSALCLAVDHFYCSCSRCWWAQTIKTC